MKINRKEPARIFLVGKDREIEMHDCGQIELNSNEQLTFKTPSGGEWDVARKEWGFYATPSLNGRLKDFNLRAVLVKNSDARFYMLLVEGGKENEFETYLKQTQMEIIVWMDKTSELEKLSG